MATKDTVVQELVVNTLTQAQFDAAKEAGTLSPYELYGTPDTTSEQLKNKLDVGLENAVAETKTTIVGWGIPDYSAGVSFTPAVGTTFTAPSDGIALVYLSVTGGNGNLVFNGTTIGLFGGSNANHNNFLLPVNKGDIITVTMNVGAIGNSIGNFYPLKGAN